MIRSFDILSVFVKIYLLGFGWNVRLLGFLFLRMLGLFSFQINLYFIVLFTQKENLN